MSTLVYYRLHSSKYYCSLELLSYFIPLGLIALHFLYTRKTLLVKMYQFQPMKTSTLIILQVVIEIVLDRVYSVTVDVFKIA